MQNERNFKHKAENFFAGKGFYIVLILCLAVIGASTWVILNTAGLAGPAAEVSAPASQGGNALAEEPVIGVHTPAAQPDSGAADGPDEPDGSDTASADAETDAETPAETAPAAADGGASETVSAPAETPASSLTFVRPVSGAVSFDYAMDALVYNKTMADWRVHGGMDFAADAGADVAAAADGTVSDLYSDDLLGTTVVISHPGGLCTLYANLASVPAVSVGDAVSAGDVIGAVGNTAIGESSEVTHLHFAMTLNGEIVNPADYLPA